MQLAGGMYPELYLETGLVGEKINSVGIVRTSYGRYVPLVAPIVFMAWSDVPSFNFMNGPTFAFL